MPSQWAAPPRPAEHVEQRLIEAILDGTYPPGSTLPGERDLAALLGVTRPTLREALQRMARDGWITIQQGKPTEIRDIWTEGGLNVLSSLVPYGHRLPFDFVPRLLEVRVVLAPAYAAAAVRRGDDAVAGCLRRYTDLADDPHAYAEFDWRLHHTLTVASGNPIYTLIINGFAEIYPEMASLYFSLPEARHSSRRFYAALLDAVEQRDAESAEKIVRRTMDESLALWRKAGGGG